MPVIVDAHADCDPFRPRAEIMGGFWLRMLMRIEECKLIESFLRAQGSIVSGEADILGSMRSLEDEESRALSDCGKSNKWAVHTVAELLECPSFELVKAVLLSNSQPNLFSNPFKGAIRVCSI